MLSGKSTRGDENAGDKNLGSLYTPNIDIRYRNPSRVAIPRAKRTRRAIKELLRAVMAPMPDAELEERAAAAEHCVDLDACRCGKYRGKAPAMVSAVEHAAKDALAEFGYEPPRESGALG